MKSKGKYELLPKAPIVQAILEIKVDLPKSFKLEKLDKLQRALKDDYPVTLNQIQGKFTIKPHAGTSVIDSETSQIGYCYYTESGSRSVLATMEQFNYIQSEQYTSWEEFKKVASDLWDKYTSVTKPIKIRRVSLRYINRIDIKLPIMDISDHFLSYPEISKKLPQEIQNYYLRYSIPYKDENVLAHITQAIEVPEKKVIPFLFDIDVLYQKEMEFDNEELWKKFDLLRDIKNDLFFDNLTDSTIKNLK